MNALKTLARSVFEKVVEDEYLEPLSFQEVYAIITRLTIRNSSSAESKQLTIDSDTTDLLSTIDKFSIVCPEREIKRLGHGLSYQKISNRIKQLSIDLQEVDNLMLTNYDIYQYKIQQSLSQLESNKNLDNAKSVAKILKLKLANLNKVAKHTYKISQHNIKLKNLKAAIQYLKIIPRVQKMSLIELKNLRVEEKISKLECLKHLDSYIEKQVNSQLRGVIQVIKANILKFDSDQYESAVRNFIITEHPNIKYEKLVMKVIENEVRNFQLIELEAVLSFFVQIIVNTHKICSWHRDKQKELDIHKEIVSLNVQQIQISTSKIIDETLCSTIYERINSEQLKRIYEILYLLNRFFEIGYRFCGYVYNDTIKELKIHLNRRVRNVAEKSLHELVENLYMEESNDWSRLPIPNDYRHQGIEKILCTVKKYEQCAIYSEVELKGLVYLQQKYEDNHQELTWEIEAMELPNIDKIQKYREVVRLQFPHEVVLCQSALSVLRHFENLGSMLFYMPVVRQSTMEVMLAHAEYYMYYLFGSFISQNLKDLVMLTNYERIDEKYLQRRILHKYRHLVSFIKKFQARMKSYPDVKIQIKEMRKQQKVIIKSRVVSTESARFILANLAHIANIITRNSVKEITTLQITLSELLELLYVDCIPKICSIESSLNIVSGIKWAEEREYDMYLNSLESLMKDFSNKIKGLGKGQIPQRIIQNLFGVYWKTQITFMMGTFLKDCRLPKNGKARFERFLDQLYGRVLSFQSQQILVDNFKRIKKIFLIIYEAEWVKVFQLLKNSLNDYEYILRLTLNIFYASECAVGLSQKELKQKEELIIKYVQNNCLIQ